MRAEYTNVPTFNSAQRKSSLEIRISEKKKNCWVHSLMEWGLRFGLNSYSVRGIQRLFSVKYIYEKAHIVWKFL